eukprot:1496413-Amphidinium_carterae.1
MPSVWLCRTTSAASTLLVNQTRSNPVLGALTFVLLVTFRVSVLTTVPSRGISFATWRRSNSLRFLRLLARQQKEEKQPVKVLQTSSQMQLHSGFVQDFPHTFESTMLGHCGLQPCFQRASEVWFVTSKASPDVVFRVFVEQVPPDVH